MNIRNTACDNLSRIHQAWTQKVRIPCVCTSCMCLWHMGLLFQVVQYCVVVDFTVLFNYRYSKALPPRKCTAQKKHSLFMSMSIKYMNGFCSLSLSAASWTPWYEPLHTPQFHSKTTKRTASFSASLSNFPNWNPPNTRPITCHNIPSVEITVMKLPCINIVNTYLVATSMSFAIATSTGTPFFRCGIDLS